MLADPPAEPAKTEKVEAAPEPKTEAPEPKADEVAAPGPAAGEEHKEAESEPAAEETEAIEEELAPGVQKKIAKEVARGLRANRAITEAISNRKAAEDKLAKLIAGKPGSEPAKITAPAATEAKPERPDLDTFPGTYPEYQAALKKFDADHESYLIAKTERTVEERLTARQREDSLKRDWDGATEEHGAEFPEHMKTLAASSPEGLQLAISGLDNWSQVAVHLAKTPAELKALAAKWDVNPYAAVAELGKLEARLQTESKPPDPAKTPAKAAPKPLSAPPPKPGGNASPIVAVDLEAADQGVFNREMKAILARR